MPGAWVEPPYIGGLWTPGYWGFYGGRYLFYPGHWGMHIGFYGGINYGFGYIGFGYEGGYWNGGHFFYNRVYNNINVRVVHNVYNYRAGNRGSGTNRNNAQQPRTITTTTTTTMTTILVPATAAEMACKPGRSQQSGRRHTSHRLRA